MQRTKLFCLRNGKWKRQPAEAKAMFLQAWNEATTDVEKFTAAHFVARCQSSTEDKCNGTKQLYERLRLLLSVS